MSTIDIALAERAWRRSFSQGVRRSIAKTLTEPITNAYDSYKRLPDLRALRSTGLVDAVLALNVGDVLDHGTIAKRLVRAPRRSIRVRVSTVKDTHLAKRQCQIIDNAEGMSFVSMQTKLRYRGSDCSGQAQGAAVRGLFGQGLGDVLFGHFNGEIQSVVDRDYYHVQAVWEGEPEKQPKLRLAKSCLASARIREMLGISAGNGTAVSFILHEDCHLPQTPDDLYSRLCNFYMLRLINSDPTCDVILEQHRSGGQLLETRLQCQMPRGTVLDKTHADVPINGFPPISAEAVLLRSDTELPGVGAEDDRASGLLVVDECDTVYDQTLFSFDTDSNIECLYGVVRLTGVRPVIRHYLDQRHEALLTDSRDGFDKRRVLYQRLAAALDPWIKRQVEAEQKRRQGADRRLSADMTKRVQEAFQELNNLYKEETGEKIDNPGPGPDPTVPATIEFSEREITLRQGRPRRVALLVNPRVVAVGAQVILESDCNQIRVEPPDVTFTEKHLREGRIGIVPLLISSDVLGAMGHISACAEAQDGSTPYATANVLDTVPMETVFPPESGIEFNPDCATVKPHVRRNLQLWIDTNVVPIGTDIMVRLFDHVSGLWLLTDDDQPVTTTPVRVRDRDRHSTNPRVARVLVAFRGSGYGQRGSVRANVDVGGRTLEALASIRIQEQEPPPGAGIFSDLDYDARTRSRYACIFDRGSGKLVVNSCHPVNERTFGRAHEEFSRAIETNVSAQMRLAEIVLDECIYHIAATKYTKGGEHGLDLGRDPITDIRNFIEKTKFKIGPRVFRHFVSLM